MRYLLSASSRPVLSRLAQERTLCAFDFDGTLSPIVEHPEQAFMRERTRGLLTRLSALYPCIIVSGRAREDVLKRAGNVGVRHIIGGHGAETEHPDSVSQAEVRQRVQQWKATLEDALGLAPGLWIEDKGTSLAIHYRQFPGKVEARQRIAAATRQLEGVRVFGGKEVVNLVGVDSPHKGSALAAERARFNCDWVLFVGDDDNDEDAFALEGNTVPVRVGRKVRSHARYFLRNQGEIDPLLDALVGLREAATPPARS